MFLVWESSANEISGLLDLLVFDKGVLLHPPKKIVTQ
jgi:hypothetical protein